MPRRASASPARRPRRIVSAMGAKPDAEAPEALARAWLDLWERHVETASAADWAAWFAAAVRECGRGA